MRRMIRSRKLRFVLVVVAITLIFVVAAANAGPKKGDKPSEDWSRSLPIGQDVSGSVSLVVDASGERIYMIWPYDGESGERFRFVQLNERGEVTANSDLQFPGHIRTPRLLPAADELLHLLWASRLEGEENWQLWHVLLTAGGRPVGEPGLVSPEGTRVGRFVVAGVNRDQILLAWDRASQGGLVMRRLDGQGAPLSETIDRSSPSITSACPLPL